MGGDLTPCLVVETSPAAEIFHEDSVRPGESDEQALMASIYTVYPLAPLIP